MTGRVCWLFATDRSVTIGRHSLAQRHGGRMRTYHLLALETVARFLKIAAAD
jgi:hypothetical protein